MSKLRSVSTAFWSDTFIEELSPNEKLLFLYLITNDKTNMLGIYELSIKKMSFDTGIDKDIILKALKKFESLSKVKYVKNHIVLVNFMKHQNYNTNMKKSAIDIYNELPNELKNSELSISKDNPLEGFERLSNHYGMVSKEEAELEYEIEEEKEIKDTPSAFSFYYELLKLGADKQLVSDWLAVRKKKKLTNTETALKGFLKQVDKSGNSLNDVLTKCIEKSWGGFEADWYKKEKRTEEKIRMF